MDCNQPDPRRHVTDHDAIAPRRGDVVRARRPPGTSRRARRPSARSVHPLAVDARQPAPALVAGARAPEVTRRIDQDDGGGAEPPPAVDLQRVRWIDDIEMRRSEREIAAERELGRWF